MQLAAAGRHHLRAVILLLRIERGLRTGTLPCLAARLGIALDLTSGTTPSKELAVLPAATRTAVRAAERVLRRWPFGGSCLRRCLVLGVILHDLHPVLRIGVRRDDTEFASHAWLEIDGRPTDPAAAAFQVLHGGMR